MEMDPFLERTPILNVKISDIFHCVLPCGKCVLLWLKKQKTNKQQKTRIHHNNALKIL